MPKGNRDMSMKSEEERIQDIDLVSSAVNRLVSSETEVTSTSQNNPNKGEAMTKT